MEFQKVNGSCTFSNCTVENTTSANNLTDTYHIWVVGGIEFILAACILGTVSLIGLIGNVLTLMTLLRMRTCGQWLPMYTFLCHLAISDIMVCIICIPLTLMMNFAGSINVETTNDISCKVSRFFQFMGPGGSIILLLTVAYDRYKNIVSPLKAGRRGHLYQPAFLVSFAWVYATIAFMPAFYFAHVESLHTQTSWSFIYCITIPNNNLLGVLYLTLLSIMTFLVPLVLMFYFYFRVIRTVWFREKKLRSTIGTLRAETGKALRRSKRKTLKMLLTVLSVFLVCWSPFVIYTGFAERYVAPFPNPADTARFVTYGIGLFNSLCNPIIYFFSSPPFRKQMKLLICCSASPRKTSVVQQAVRSTLSQDLATDGTAFGSLQALQETQSRARLSSFLFHIRSEKYVVNE